MDNTEKLITEIFQNEIQIKRIKKELQQIYQLNKKEFKITLKKLSPNLQIIIEMQPIDQLNYGKPILFALYLDSKFPFVFPQVHILSQITKPQLSNGKDYLENIISVQWSPQILLFEIIKQFPIFLEKIKQSQHDEDYLLKLGQFYEFQKFDLRLDLENVEILECKQIINGKQYPRTLLVSDRYILNLEHQNKEFMLLNCYCSKDLQKVERVQKNIHLSWLFDSNLIVLTLTSSNIDQLYDIFYAFKQNQTQLDINQAYIQQQSNETIQINELLQQMNLNEEELSKNLNKVTLNNLVTSYSKAIEYYSSFSDEDYKQYVIRFQKLLGREDVQNILANPVK